MLLPTRPTSSLLPRTLASSLAPFPFPFPSLFLVLPCSSASLVPSPCRPLSPSSLLPSQPPQPGVSTARHPSPFWTAAALSSPSASSASPCVPPLRPHPPLCLPGFPPASPPPSSNPHASVSVSSLCLHLPPSTARNLSPVTTLSPSRLPLSSSHLLAPPFSSLPPSLRLPPASALLHLRLLPPFSSPPSLLNHPKAGISGPSTARHPSPFWMATTHISPHITLTSSLPRASPPCPSSLLPILFVPRPRPSPLLPISLPPSTSSLPPSPSAILSCASHPPLPLLVPLPPSHCLLVPMPPSSCATFHYPNPRLDHFIAYALHRTRLHPSVTFVALYLLQHLKARFPAAKGSSGQRLYISAFVLASKIICDDTYSNKSWCTVGQGMFALREINQMEREMCSYLEWQLNVDPTTLRDFESRVRHDFAPSTARPSLSLLDRHGHLHLLSSFPHLIPRPRPSPPLPSILPLPPRLLPRLPRLPSPPTSPHRLHSPRSHPRSVGSTHVLRHT